MNRIQYRIDFSVDQSSLTGIKKSLADLKQMVPKDFMRIDPKIDLNEARSQMMKMKNSINEIERAYDQAFDSDLGVLNLQKFNQGLNNLDLAEVESRLGKAGVAGQRAFTQLAQSALTTNVQLKQTTNWLDSISKTLGSTIRWGISSRIMNEFVGTVQGAYGYVKELDKTLNDIRIVTGKNADEMRRFAKEANTASQNLGETTTSYTKASLIYYQQGLSDEETKARAETTLKTANVTGQSGEEVSEQLTAVWNGYKVAAEETELYVDKLAAVAATTASDLEELSTGMSKVASAASTTGVSIDELSAQMSTIISVTRQAPESVGTALKTIYARMTSLELGETDEDGMNLAKVTQSMSDMGIEVLDETGNLRDLGTVIEEVGAKWNTWTEAQRAAMAQTLAGTRQYNNLYALFENWDMYLSALETSQGSAGTLQKQQDVYMESTEAHLDRMAAAAENFQDSLLDDRGINTFADIMTTINNLLAGFTDSIGGGTGAVLNLGAILTKVFKKQIATGIAPILNNIGATKFNKQQFDAVEKNIEAWKKQENIQGKAAKAMLDYQTEMKKYWHLMSDEEKKASMKRVKEIGYLEQLQEEWENANKAVTEYANSVKATGDTRTTGEIVQDKALQFEGLASSGQALRESGVNKSKGVYKDPIKAKEKAKEYKEYLKVYEEYGKKLKLIQEQQKKGVKFSENESAVIKQLQTAYDGFDKKQLKAIQTIAAFADRTDKLESEDLTELNNALREIGGIDVLRDIVPKDTSQKVEALTEEIVEQSRAIKENSKEIEINEGKRRDADILRDQRNRQRVEAGTELISTLSSMGSLINNMTAIPNIWANNDISDGEKIIQTISNVGMTIASVGPQAMTAVKGIKEAKAVGDTLALTMSSLNIAALGVGLALGIFSTIKTAIDNNVASIQEKNKATIEETKATTEQIKANNELYESYKLNEQQYKSGEMSKQELLNTTEDLINAYDIENGHLMRLTGNYEGLSLAIEKARKEEAKYALDTAKRETTAAKQNAELNLKNIDADWIDTSDISKNLVLGTGLKEDAKKVLSDTLGDSFYGKIQGPSLGSVATKAVSTWMGPVAGLIGNAIGSGMDLQTDYLASFDLSSAGGIVEMYDKLVKVRQQLEEQGIEDDTLKNNIDEQIKALNESIPDLKAAVESIGNALVLNADAGQKLNLAENSKEASEYIANFRAEMEALNAELPESQRLTQDQLNEKMVEYLDGVENIYVQRQVVIGKLQDKLVGDAKAMVDDLTNEQLSFLMTCEIDENTTKETIENLLYSMQNWLDSDPDYSLLIKMRAEGISDEDLKSLSDDYKKALLSGTEFYSEDTINDLISKAAQGAIDTNRNVLVGVGENRAAEEREELKNRKKDELTKIDNEKRQDSEYQELLKLNEVLSDYKQAMQNAVLLTDKSGKKYYDYSALSEESRKSILKFAEISNLSLTELEAVFATQGDKIDAVIGKLTGFDKSRFEELDKYYDDQVSDIESKFEAAQNAINDLDFDKVRQTIGETINLGIDSTIDNIETLVDKIELIGEGFIVAAEDADTFIERFPALLDGAKVLADGSIKLDQEVVESNRKTQEDKIKAQYDAQIAELDMQIALAKAQMEFDEANYQAMQDYVNGKSNESELVANIEKNKIDYIKKLQNSQAAQEIDNFDDILEQNGLMTGATIDNLNEVGKAAENVGKTIMAALSGELTDGFEGYNKDQIKNALPKKILTDVTKAVKPSGMPTSAWEAALEAGAEDNFTSRVQEEDEFKATEAFLEDSRVKAENSRAYWENLLKQRYDLATVFTNFKSMGLDDAEALESLKDIFDIYHNVNVELGLTESHLNKLIDLQEQLTGQELLDNIREQNAYLEKQNQLTKDKYAIMSGEKEMYKQQLLNKGFKFDGETGAISNYWEAMEANLSYVNSEIEKYQGVEGKEEYVESLKEEYEQMIEAVEKYDELLTSKLPGLEAEMREIQKQIVENNIKAFDVEINMHLETKDITSEWNDFIKDFTLDEDDFVGRLQQDAASGLGEITGNLMGESVQRANEVMAEIIKMQSGEESEIFENDMAKAQEKLKELQAEVINNATAFKEYCDSIEESYFNLLDSADERLEEHYKKYEQIQKKLTNSVRMTELVFGENAYGKKAKLYEAQHQANIGELDARRQEIEMWKEQLSDPELSKEEYDRIYGYLTEAQNALNEKVVESLEFIKTKYENAVHEIFDDMNKELLGMSLDNAKLEWEFATKMDNTYLDNIEKGYELQKLSYDYEKSKNGLSENALKRINALQAEQMEYLREKENLTQYDIDRSSALLDIEMKRIALEEAENNKTSMRLRRDSQGNYSYQFVADQDAINEAKENLADAERNLYDLDKEKFISTSQEMEAYLAEQSEKWINADAEDKKIIEENARKVFESMGIEGQTAYSNLAQSSQMAADSLGLNIGEISEDYMNNLFPQMDTSIAKTFELGTSAEDTGEKFGSVFDGVVTKLKEAGDTYDSEKSSIEESSGVFFGTIEDDADDAEGAVSDLNTATGNLITALSTEIDTGKGIYKGMKTLRESMNKTCKKASDTVTAIKDMVKTWNDVELKDIKAEMPNGTNFTTDVGDVNYQDPVKSGGGSGVGINDDVVEPTYLTKDKYDGAIIKKKGTIRPFNYIEGKYTPLSDKEIYGVSDIDKIPTSEKDAINKKTKWQIVYINGLGDYFLKNLSTNAAGWVKKIDIDRFDTGGYTGEWNDTRGRLAMLHQKELVLNAQDTPRMLEAINITREMQNFIEAMRSHSVKDLMFSELELSFAKAAQALNQATESIQQQVQIEANFPDVRDAKEIEEALNNLVNMASQYAYRSKR